MLLQAEASQLVPASWLFSYLRERWLGSSRDMRACRRPVCPETQNTRVQQISWQYSSHF